MNAYDAMFAIDCVAGAISLACVGGIVRAQIRNRELRIERDDAIEAWRDEEVERARWKELAEDALVNIEDLREQLNEAKAAAGRWAGKYIKANIELRRITAEREAAANKRRAHMRRIAIIGNKSPRRKREAA